MKMNEEFYYKLLRDFPEEMNYIERNYRNNSQNFKENVIDKMKDSDIIILIDDDIKIRQSFLSYFLT